MIASKVTIMPDTFKRNRVSKNQAAHLKRQKVKELIASRPYMSYIPIQDFMDFTGVKYNGNMSDILRRMVEAGTVVREQIGGTAKQPRWGYALAGQVKKTMVRGDIPGQVYTIPRPDKPTPPYTRPNATDILKLAKDFVWETGSNDLKEFVDWCERWQSNEIQP